MSPFLISGKKQQMQKGSSHGLQLVHVQTAHHTSISLHCHFALSLAQYTKITGGKHRALCMCWAQRWYKQKEQLLAHGQQMLPSSLSHSPQMAPALPLALLIAPSEF